MCGRYSLALRPAQVRHMLQDDNMPVDEAPEDEGEGAPRQSYNFAPGYQGIVCRADVPDQGAGAGPHRHAEKSGGDDDDGAKDQDGSGGGGDDDVLPSAPTKASNPAAAAAVRYKLQSMKWGLVPFWTKRNPDYASMMKTINCRDDSLAQSGGMWNTMKARKRCVVIAQGFYEWLKKDGGRTKIPHFVKRKDGALMCLAGLWDCVQYENAETKHYTYTIITTDSNPQLGFLHDRMPVILDNGSEALRTWLDPGRHEWTRELQALLKPFEGELDVYPVHQDVGKVGNNSPSFIVPLDSKENKSNIANFFFAKGAAKGTTQQPHVKAESRRGFVQDDDDDDSSARGADDALPAAAAGEKSDGRKRAIKEEEEAEEAEVEDNKAPGRVPPLKKPKRAEEQQPPLTPPKGARPKISATRNRTKSPEKPRQPPGTRKITQFFGNSS